MAEQDLRTMCDNFRDLDQRIGAHCGPRGLDLALIYERFYLAERICDTPARGRVETLAKAKVARRMCDTIVAPFFRDDPTKALLRSLIKDLSALG